MSYSHILLTDELEYSHILITDELEKLIRLLNKSKILRTEQTRVYISSYVDAENLKF